MCYIIQTTTKLPQECKLALNFLGNLFGMSYNYNCKNVMTGVNIKMIHMKN